jgi:hypothetical protein
VGTLHSKFPLKCAFTWFLIVSNGKFLQRLFGIMAISPLYKEVTNIMPSLKPYHMQSIPFCILNIKKWKSF